MKRLFFIGVLVLGLAMPALADEGFGRIDTNGDDSVTWEEFSAAYPTMREPAFTAIDTNGDGLMSHDEWHAFQERHGKDGRGMGGMGGMSMPPKKMQKEKGKQLIMPPATKN